MLLMSTFNIFCPGEIKDTKQIFFKKKKKKEKKKEPPYLELCEISLI